MTTLIQRPLRGSRISSFYPIKSLPSLSSLDSAFQLQEYISLLIRLDVHDVDAIVSLPGKNMVKEGSPDASSSTTSNNPEEAKDDKTGEQGKGSDVTVDEACWIYEQLRRLAQDLSHPLITTLQQECTRRTCPEMKAGEWLYLCVAHGNDGAMEQCCAIDYILHTLDSATALLNSPRAFPSRLQIPQTSHRHFSSLARRLGRIFAHAYFHHREAFEQAEAESSLYARFLALTSKFYLVPPEFLVIPPTSSSPTNDDRERHPHASTTGGDHIPRLMGAAVDPQSGNSYDRHQQRVGSATLIQDREKNKSPPGLGIGYSPVPARTGSAGEARKFGRNRTDTMVHSEISSVVDGLARSTDPDTELELDTGAASRSFQENVQLLSGEDDKERALEDEEGVEDESARMVDEIEGIGEGFSSSKPDHIHHNSVLEIGHDKDIKVKDYATDTGMEAIPQEYQVDSENEIAYTTDKPPTAPDTVEEPEHGDSSTDTDDRAREDSGSNVDHVKNEDGEQVDDSITDLSRHPQIQIQIHPPPLSPTEQSSEVTMERHPTEPEPAVSTDEHGDTVSISEPPPEIKQSSEDKEVNTSVDTSSQPTPASSTIPTDTTPAKEVAPEHKNPTGVEKSPEEKHEEKPTGENVVEGSGENVKKEEEHKKENAEVREEEMDLGTHNLDDTYEISAFDFHGVTVPTQPENPR